MEKAKSQQKKKRSVWDVAGNKEKAATQRAHGKRREVYRMHRKKR